MKMTEAQFFQWASQRIQYTENEMLSPHNKDIADNEVVEVISWGDFVDLAYNLINEDIKIVEEEKK